MLIVILTLMLILTLICLNNDSNTIIIIIIIISYHINDNIYNSYEHECYNYHDLLRGNHLSNTTCLTQALFKRGEECGESWCSLTPQASKTNEAVLDGVREVVPPKRRQHVVSLGRGLGAIAPHVLATRRAVRYHHYYRYATRLHHVIDGIA